MADAAFPSRAVPTRGGPRSSRQATLVGCAPQLQRDESPGVERSPANAVVALQRTAGNRATARAIAVLQRQPTFGNLFPDDAPAPDAEVVLLEKADGKWRETGSRFNRTARGTYDFVVRDGRLWAVKAKRTMGAPGHIEAAQGNRAAFAGQVTFEAGILKGWNDGSGHFRPAAADPAAEVFRKAAIDAGLDKDAFGRHPDNLKRPRPRGEKGPQLPVEQPATRPRTPGEAAKVGPGPSRLDELERYRAPRSAPAAPTPPVDLDVYRGTTPGWEGGEIARGKSSVHDLGEGVYMSQDRSLAQKYAVERARELRFSQPETRGVVYHVPLLRDDLKDATVFDFFSGQNRAKWDAHLDKVAQYPGLKQVVERLRAGRGQAENYNSLFEDFMHEHGLKPGSFDIIIGPEYRAGGKPQVCIKSARMRMLVQSRMAKTGPLESETAKGDFALVVNKPAPLPESKPAAQPQPESQGKPSLEPRTKPAPRPPPASKVDVDVPQKGTRTSGRVSVEFDTTDPKVTDPVRVKGLDVSDYPPDRPGPVTRFFNDHPVTAKLTGIGASAGAAYLSGKMLDLVESHFSGAVDEAFSDLDRAYPLPDDLLEHYDIPEKHETFDAVMNWLDDANLLEMAASAENLRQAEENLNAAVGYITGMEGVQEHSIAFNEQLEDIASDISKRADVLLEIARNLESSFEWIHTHVIGSLPFVYYETFTIWNARTVFADLGQQVSALAGTARSRQSEYKDLSEALNQRIAKANERMNPWWPVWRAHRDLLKPAKTP